MGFLDHGSTASTSLVLPVVLASAIWYFIHAASVVCVSRVVTRPRLSTHGANATLSGAFDELRTGIISGTSVLVSSSVNAVIGLVTNPGLIFAVIVFSLVGLATTAYMPNMIRFADEGYESIHAPVIVPLRFVLNILRLVVGAIYPLWIAAVHAFSIPFTLLAEVLTHCSRDSAGRWILTDVAMETLQAGSSALTATARWLFADMLRAPLDLTPAVAHYRAGGRAAVAVAQCSCPAVGGLYAALGAFLYTNRTDEAISETVNALLSLVQVPLNATIRSVWRMRPQRMNTDYVFDRVRNGAIAVADVLNIQIASIVEAVEVRLGEFGVGAPRRHSLALSPQELAGESAAAWTPPPVFSPGARLITVASELLRVPVNFANCFDLVVRRENANFTYALMRGERFFDEVDHLLNVTFKQVVGGTPLPSLSGGAPSLPFANLGDALFWLTSAISRSVSAVWETMLAVVFGAVPGTGILLPGDPFQGILNCSNTYAGKNLTTFIGGNTDLSYVSFLFVMPAHFSARVEPRLRLYGDAAGKAAADFKLQGIANTLRFSGHATGSVLYSVLAQMAYFAAFPLATRPLDSACPSELAARSRLDCVNLVEAIPDIIDQVVDLRTAIQSGDAHHICSQFTHPNYFYYGLAAFFHAGDVCNPK